MRIDEIVREANNHKDSYTEKDAADFFKKNNFGHWPNERGEIDIKADNGEIKLTIGRNIIGSDQDLTPSGKVWLIRKFFEDTHSTALTDFKSVEQYKSKSKKIKKQELANPQEFHNRIVKRMSDSYTKFVRSGDTRLAFVERKRVNSDGSIIYGYDINILDNDKTSKYALMLPGLKTIINVFEEYKGKIVRSPITVDGRMFEAMEDWERAEYIAMTHIDIFDYENVTYNQLNASFLLTEAIDVSSQARFFNI